MAHHSFVPSEARSEPRCATRIRLLLSFSGSGNGRGVSGSRTPATKLAATVAMSGLSANDDDPCLDIFQAIQDASRTGPNELRAAAADTETFERSLTEPETPCCITLR